MNAAELIQSRLTLPEDSSAMKPAATAVYGETESGRDEMTEAVNRLFEQTRRLQPSLDEFAGAVGLVERVGKKVDPAFLPIRALHKHLSEFAVSFDFFRDFQSRIAELAETFEPMKDLYGQTRQVSENLQSELTNVIKLLDPAKNLADRVGRLGRLLQQADDLRRAFAQLYSDFHISDCEA